MGALKVMPLRSLRTGARMNKNEGVTNGLQMRVSQGLRLSVLWSARDCRRDADGLRAQVTRLEAGLASRGKAAG